MDNNMIHIDDLVRQRLRGGEEPERPGAWLTMRELLDKEMPVSAGYNWRRIIGYFTALLLLTTASVGGYRMYTGHVADTRTASGGGGGRDGDGAYGVPSGGAVDNSFSDNAAVSTNINVTAAAHNADAKSAAANAHAQPSVTFIGTQTPAHRNSKPPENALGALQTASAEHPAVSKRTQIVADAAKHADNGIAASISKRTASANSIYASAANATVHGRRRHSTPSQLSSGAIAALQAAAPNAAALSNVTAPRPLPATLRHDTIERLEIVYRRAWDADANRHYYRIDTFPAGKIVVDRILPAQQELALTEQPAKPKRHGLFGHKSSAKTSDSDNAIELAPKSSAEQTPASGRMALASVPAPVVPNAAAPAAKTTEQQVGLTAAAIATASIKSHQFRLWDAEKVDAAINKFKVNLARIQMYPGIMGGINASVFTPNALGGFQLGLTSLFVLNDWWSVMTELKYIHRFNTGSSVRDDYMNVVSGTGTIGTTTINGQQYKEYRWQDESVNHSFNYDVVKTFEVPLMLRYSWGRFYSQGGVNLIYSTAIQAKEVTQARGDYKWHTEYRPNTHDDEPFIKNDQPYVQITDFGSRFGTGYILSGGYMFSPAVYFDARVTQTFWDNSKTGGGKQISRDLLRTPSIQLSVGYRFNAKK